MPKVKLLRDSRIKHYAGEIIEVSPEECHFLVSTDGAVEVNAVKAPAEVIETPEEKVIEKIETPEKKVVKKTTAKKPVAKKK